MKSTDFIKEAPVQYSTTFQGAPESHPMYNTYYQQELAKRKNLPSGEETAKIMAANRVKADMAKAGATAFPVAPGQQMSAAPASPPMTGSKTDPRNPTPYNGPTIPQPAPVAQTAPVKPLSNIQTTNTEPDETDDMRGGQSQNAPLPAGGFRAAAQSTAPAAQPSATGSAAVGANPMQPAAAPAASTPATPAAPAGQTAAKGSWQEIYNMNKAVIGANPNLIKPGQQLKMPDGTTYIVKSGDSLSKIAASRGKSLTPVEQISYFKNIIKENIALAEAPRQEPKLNLPVADNKPRYKLGADGKPTPISQQPATAAQDSSSTQKGSSRFSPGTKGDVSQYNQSGSQAQQKISPPKTPPTPPAEPAPSPEQNKSRWFKPKDKVPVQTSASPASTKESIWQKIIQSYKTSKDARLAAKAAQASAVSAQNIQQASRLLTAIRAGGRVSMVGTAFGALIGTAILYDMQQDFKWARKAYELIFGAAKVAKEVSDSVQTAVDTPADQTSSQNLQFQNEMKDIQVYAQYLEKIDYWIEATQTINPNTGNSIAEDIIVGLTCATKKYPDVDIWKLYVQKGDAALDQELANLRVGITQSDRECPKVPSR